MDTPAGTRGVRAAVFVPREERTEKVLLLEQLELKNDSSDSSGENKINGV